MTALSSLWLPILLSAVAVFVASSVIHMFTPWHKTDFQKLPDEDRTRDGFPRKEFTPANYADCKTQTQIFEEVTAISEDFFNLTMVGGEPERLIGEKVTWNLFPMLGAAPILGRAFLPEEDRPGSEHEVVSVAT